MRKLLLSIWMLMLVSIIMIITVVAAEPPHPPFTPTASPVLSPTPSPTSNRPRPQLTINVSNAIPNVGEVITITGVSNGASDEYTLSIGGTLIGRIEYNSTVNHLGSDPNFTLLSAFASGYTVEFVLEVTAIGTTDLSINVIGEMFTGSPPSFVSVNMDSSVKTITVGDAATPTPPAGWEAPAVTVANNVTTAVELNQSFVVSATLTNLEIPVYELLVDGESIIAVASSGQILQEDSDSPVEIINMSLNNENATFELRSSVPIQELSVRVTGEERTEDGAYIRRFITEPVPITFSGSGQVPTAVSLSNTSTNIIPIISLITVALITLVILTNPLHKWKQHRTHYE